jgi:hypothetical protein
MVVTVSATIDGVAWTAVTNVSFYTPGVGLVIEAGDLKTLLGISAPVTGPGTYPLNSDAAYGNVEPLAGGEWSSDQTGGSGSVTVTTVTANHAVGTFAFNAVSTDGKGSVKHVTNGKFDVKY